MTPSKPATFLVLTPESEIEKSSAVDEPSLADSPPQAARDRARTTTVVYFILILQTADQCWTNSRRHARELLTDGYGGTPDIRRNLVSDSKAQTTVALGYIPTFFRSENKKLKKFIPRVEALVVAGCSSTPPTIQERSNAEVSYDGLHAIDNSVFTLAWADPDIDFSRYNKMIPGGAVLEFRAVKKSSVTHPKPGRAQKTGPGMAALSRRATFPVRRG